MESRRDGKPRNVPQGVASGLKASHGFGLALDYKSMAGLYDGLRGSGFVIEKAYYALIAPALLSKSSTCAQLVVAILEARSLRRRTV